MYIGYEIDEQHMDQFLRWKRVNATLTYQQEVLPEVEKKGILSRMLAKREYKMQMAKAGEKSIKSLRLRKDEDGNMFYTMCIAGQNYIFKNFVVYVDGYYSKEDTRDWVRFNSEVIGAEYIKYFKLIQEEQKKAELEYFLGEYAATNGFKVIGSPITFKRKEEKETEV